MHAALTSLDLLDLLDPGAHDAARVGCEAARLASAARAGLPVFPTLVVPAHPAPLDRRTAEAIARSVVARLAPGRRETFLVRPSYLADDSAPSSYGLSESLLSCDAGDLAEMLDLAMCGSAAPVASVLVHRAGPIVLRGVLPGTGNPAASLHITFAERTARDGRWAAAADEVRLDAVVCDARRMQMVLLERQGRVSNVEWAVTEDDRTWLVHYWPLPALETFSAA